MHNPPKNYMNVYSNRSHEYKATVVAWSCKSHEIVVIFLFLFFC